VKLYFFPAVLPLVELLPVLLTAFAAIAGFLLGARGRFQRFVWPARIALATAIVALAWFGWPTVYWRLNPNASRLTVLPKFEIISPPPAEEVQPARAFVRGRWREDWRVPIRGRALSSLVLSGGLLMVGTWESTVDAYSTADGAHVWRVQKREPVYSLTLASPNLLIAGEGLHTSQSASLTALELPSGRPLWQREFRGHIESAPTTKDNKIWFGAGPSGLWCLDLLTGTVLWHSAVGHVDSTPLVEGGKVFFAAQPSDAKPTSILHALDASTGAPLWELPLPGQPWGSPKLLNGMLLTTTGLGQVGVNLATDRGWAHAVTPEGKLVWSSELGGNPIEASVPLPTLGLSAVTLTNGQVVAVRIRDGAIAWRQVLSAPSQADLTVERGSFTLAATLTNGEVHFLDARNGAPLEIHKIDSDSSSAPLFSPSGLYIAGPATLRKIRW
jgi:outer membrane protein assembly factor BamB